jgi:hypothetical protein
VGASKAQRAATAARRDRAVQMRMACAGWQQIATALGYADKAAACKDVTRALERNNAALRASTETLRTLDLDRLDRMQLGLWPTAIAGDSKATDAVLRIMQWRARLTGTEIPPDAEDRIRQEMTVRIGAQMATVWGRVLSRLQLTAEQNAAVAGLLDEEIGAFVATASMQQRAIDGVVVDE